MTSEHEIQSASLVALSQHQCTVFRINTGKVKTSDGRWFSSGTPKGFFDCVGFRWSDRDFLSSETIGLKVVPGVDLAKNRKLSNQIANIMVNRFSWRKGRKKIDGKTQRGYIKR